MWQFTMMSSSGMAVMAKETSSSNHVLSCIINNVMELQMLWPWLPCRCHVTYSSSRCSSLGRPRAVPCHGTFHAYVDSLLYIETSASSMGLNILTGETPLAQPAHESGFEPPSQICQFTHENSPCDMQLALR